MAHNRNKLYFAAILGVIGALLSASLYPFSSDFCPEECQCFTNYVESEPGRDVQCGDRKLKTVPLPRQSDRELHLNLSYNYLDNLQEDAFLWYETVRYLYLQYSSIHTVHEDTFRPLHDLRLVDLSSNKLNFISPKLFTGNTLLARLSLARNHLASLEPEAPLLYGPPSLNVLDIKFCKISNLSPSTFAHLPNIKCLDLSGNELQFLGLKTLWPLPQLQDLRLSNNPWKCGPKFEDLLCLLYHRMNVSLKTIKCQQKDKSWVPWTVEEQTRLCRQTTAPSIVTSHVPSEVTDAVLPHPTEGTHTSYVTLYSVIALLAFLLMLALVAIFFLCRRRNTGDFGAQSRLQGDYKAHNLYFSESTSLQPGKDNEQE